MTTRRRVPGWLWRTGLGLAILAIVLAGVDARAIGAAISDADLRLVALGILGLTAIHLVPAIGWRAIQQRMTGDRLSVRTAVTAFYAAQAIGGVTPANVGGDLHRAATLRRLGHRWDAAVGPLVVQRATSYVALALLAAGAVVVIAARAPAAAPLVGIGAGVAAVVGVAAWLLLAPPAPLRGLHHRLLGHAREAPMPIGDAAVIGLLQGLTFHAAAIGLTGLLVLAVEPDARLVDVLAALAVARLAIAVPITPSGIGVQEGVAALLFGAIGLAPGLAVSAMLLSRLALVLTTLLGIALLHGGASAEAAAGSMPATTR